MSLTKKQKQDVLEQYKLLANNANTIALVLWKWITVNDATSVRMQIADLDTKIQVVRKRVFLRAMNEAWLGDPTTLWKVDGNVFALYTWENEFAPLKVISNMNKEFKKKKSTAMFDYLGGRYWKEWKDGAYVATLATLPSKEELLSKFLFLLKYPVQSFTTVLDQIKKKKEESGEA